MPLRLLLLVPIVFVTNALHLSPDTGIPGLNMSNLLFAAVVLVLWVSAGNSPGPLPAPARLSAPLSGLFLVLILGFVLAQASAPGHFMADLTYLKNAIFYPLFYFVYRHCKQDAETTRRMIILVLIVAAIAALEAVREGLSYGFGNYNLTRRASGPFGVDYSSANRAGVFYAMYLPIFVALALFLRGQKFWRLAALAGIALMLVAIMATYSRQSYLIALVGIVLLMLRRGLATTLVVAILAVAAIDFLPESVTTRVQETEQRNELGDEQLDASTASRFEIWSGAMRMWREHPLGVGLNRFKSYIGNYSIYRNFDAHNFYVLTLAEMGPLGLAAMAWLLWRLLGLARSLRHSVAARENPETRALAYGFTVMVVAMALGNVYGSPFLEGAVMTNFWILCGLLERYVALTSMRTGTAAAETVMAPSAAIGVRFPLAARSLPGRYGRETANRSHAKDAIQKMD